MPFTHIEVPPGIIKSESDYAAEGRWIDGDHVRFYRGRPEKIGGVQKLDSGIDAFTGYARHAKAWVSYTGIQCLVWGTPCYLYIYREGAQSKITPYRTDANGITLGTDPFAVTNASAIVTVTDTNHGITEAGTIVTFSGATAGGGITIDGDYAVTEVVDVNTFTITHSEPATSTDSATGGAAVVASYELNCGDVDPTYLLGWGVGAWGEGYWGTDASLASALVTEPANWSFDLYGEDLLVCPLNGGIYLHDTSSGVARPALLANAPTQNRAAFVTEERYIFAVGTEKVGGGFDPMTVRWADILDPTIWTPADTNRANERKLQGGDRLMAGTRLAANQAMIWSNTDAFLFQFIGGSTSYSSRSVGTNCGLAAQHAYITANGQAFWMSDVAFFMYSGYVQPIPNQDDIAKHVFDNINRSHVSKAFAFYNPDFNEVWFCYPSAMSTECNKYVAVALDEAYSWTVGTWDRTAATRYPIGETRPIMFGTDSIVYVHEVTTSPDDDGAALNAYIELGPTDIDGGNTCVDIFGIVPDCQRQSGDLSIYLYGLDHPRDTEVMSETLTCGETDKLVDARIAGRQIGMKITSNEVGGDFRLGKWGVEVSGAGKKRGSQA